MNKAFNDLWTCRVGLLILTKSSGTEVFHSLNSEERIVFSRSNAL